ncbi:hypothetical protein [Albidovulum sp.]|nr:hypothetical protein [Paracoccaceae bacterium]MCC0047487.1 hypothetical protein [Defluviimonas sp.]HPE24196.1 hypothetical protein [Albidovulum sp.]MCB2122628.1 hypothetical protein [Paracoccaceae bacterium]MCB2134198.1 hypothetical protein [Paracoccaceae bacterium]
MTIIAILAALALFTTALTCVVRTRPHHVPQVAKPAPARRPDTERR